MQTHLQIWNRCLQVFKDNLNYETYKAIFEPIKSLGVKQNILTLEVPSQFFVEYIEEHFFDLLKKTIRKELGPDAKLEYSIPVGKKLTKPIPSRDGMHVENTQVQPPADATIRNPFIVPGLKKLEIPSQLNPDYSFSNFIVGECNHLAHSTGLVVAEKPGGTPYNPMFLFGDSGLGKTHLAHAIGIKVKELTPDKTVLYLNATKFTTQFTDASLNNDVNNFLHFYQCIDVLIIDDVQEFVNKKKTQSTFFEIFNHLHLRGKQLILTADRPPVELNGIVDERLLSRFKWGLTVELTAPGYQTRLDILKHRAYRDGIELADNVLEYIAVNVTKNVRELEGVLIGLLAQSMHNKKAITLDLAQSVLVKLTQQTKREWSVNDILQEVSNYFHIDPQLVLSNTRRREVVQVRQVAMYFAKHLTNASLKSIGTQLGKKDHATVLHAGKIVEDLMATDRRFKLQIQDLERKFTA